MNNQAKGASVGIPPRKMRFDASALAGTYYDNDPAMTIFWNTLSMLFPEGEQFFVQAVRNYRDKITDPKLQAEISGFIGQEAFHTKAHRDINAVLKAKGYPVDKVDRILEKTLGFISSKYPMLALQVTCILEHYTATLGAQLLDNTEHNSAIQGEARKLWLHHAVEEVEHRTVSYDVLQTVGGSFTREISHVLFFPVTIVFVAAVAVLYTYNLKTQNVKLSELLSIFRLFDLLMQNAPRIADWFRKGFHPVYHEARNLQKTKSELEI